MTLIINVRHIKGLLLTIAYAVGIAYGAMIVLQSYSQSWSSYLVVAVYIVIMAFLSVKYVRQMLKWRKRGREP